MCGIIAVVRRRSERTPPPSGDLIEPIERALDLISADPGGALEGTDARQAGRTDERADLRGVLTATAGYLEAVDALMKGVPGVEALVDDPIVMSNVETLMAAVDDRLGVIEHGIENDASLGVSERESLNAVLGRVKDAAWAIRRDRLRTAREVCEFVGSETGRSAIEAYTSIQQALSAIDRLEVRGRDSAGLHILIRGHELDLASPAVQATVAARTHDPLFASMAVRESEGCLGFVYKAAAEIGELGDNTRALRRAILDDDLLRRALRAENASALVIGHTRWASVGIISQPNAHPLDSGEPDRSDVPYVTAVLNGDVDNFADLKASESLRIDPEITTDAKVIPTLASRRMAGGADPVEAFRETANMLEGSVAVAASAASLPDDLLLAVRGSGQALYLGTTEDAYIVASEPYGVVEVADRYLRIDGETRSDPANPATRGQLIHLAGADAGTVEGIERWAYDGSPLPVEDAEMTSAQITTRDIDRGDHPHYLLKEISEAPVSFRKTLSGKLIDVDGRPVVRLGDESLPQKVRDGLRDGSIARVLVIGQGTASVAGLSLVGALALAAPGSKLPVTAIPATELSGFALEEDMSDTLVVAISQSGTTTDTNRTVDLVRDRGACVIAIVNRRGSDLTDKADGVLYTSDGRDVEMSVASTKAFYSQIAACYLLAFAVAGELVAARRAEGDDQERDEILAELRRLPSLMERVLELRPQLGRAARRFAPSRRYWAIVGNGLNRIAAQEVRIKLSELCYKSIACDTTEDKKHIDLSSEPMILVCAAGLSGSTADDVAKEVAIFRAHKAAPIVIATEGEERFSAALEAILVPRTHPGLAFVLSAMAGHLFGYEAALAIDAQARPLREARAAIEAAVAASRDVRDQNEILEQLAIPIAPLAGRFFDGLRSGEYDGHLEASSAVRLASLLRYAMGIAPLEWYQVEYGPVGTPSVVIEDLTDSLTRAIEQLTRPIDAIKHQAKTVTVGISRSDETLLQVALVKAVLATGASRDGLSYGTLRTLAALEPVVEEVLGYTRYAIEDSHAPTGSSTVVVVDRGGLGRELRSRTEEIPLLRGTKHRVATERLVLLARGRSDQRTVLIIPEVKDNQTTGLVLLHVGLADELALTTLKSVLQGYRGRYSALKDAVTETEPTFRDDLLTTVPLLELMTDPIYDLADRWRT